MRRRRWSSPDELQLGWCAIDRPPSTRRRFDPDPAAIAAARRFVHCFLVGDARAEDAELIVSELATNAWRHAGSPFTVSVNLDPRLRLEVHDDYALLPVPRVASPDAVDGRGLAIVAAVACAWGSHLVARGGKVVWAELAP